MSTANLCQCHCGTRIDVDEQLLEEREMWKQKYMSLQKQFKSDIQVLKENIYAECSAIMQEQFSQREANHNRIVNQKNVQIKDLIARVVNLQSQLKVITKEKELIHNKLNQADAESSQKDELINLLRNKQSKGIREWELRHEEELSNLRKKLTSNSKDELEKVQLEKDQLKQKVKDFESKYQKIIPEVQKMKSNLLNKNGQVEELQKTIEKMAKGHEQKVGDLKQEINDLEKIHGTCPKYIKKLQAAKEELERQLEKCRKISREVKVEPVYIDRPVEVEKVVQKIIQVEKVVKKFIDDPNSPKVAQLQDQNNRLKEELNNILGEIKEMQEQYQKVVTDYEENMKAHEENVVKYKKERESLAQRIVEQSKEIEMMEAFIQKMSMQKSSKQGDGEKIVVHVKQDGSYQKTVQKLPSPKATQQNVRKKR